MADANPSFSVTANAGDKVPTQPIPEEKQKQARVTKSPTVKQFNEVAEEEPKAHEVIEDNDEHVKTKLRSGTVRTVRK